MTLPRWLYHPDESLPSDCDPNQLLGGKGALLRSLTAAGFPVPPCFTITTQACRHYWSHDRCWPDGLEQQVFEAVTRLERAAGQTFGHGTEPLLLAVRGGADVSMPGMLLTLLNCGLTRRWAETRDDDAAWGVYSRWIRDLAAAKKIDLSAVPPAVAGEHRVACERLLEQYAVKAQQAFPQDPRELLRRSITAVFDSCSSARAVAYREAYGLADSAATAVTVQVMIPTEVAGVFFSRDPRQPDADTIVVEAVAGLGDRLVSGHAEPTRYLVSRNPAVSSSAHCRVGLLDDERLHAVCDLGRSVERQLGGPVDVEWGSAAGRLVLFQARPMAARQSEMRRQEIRQAELVRVANLAREHGTRMWVRHSLGESLAAPTPLTWDLVRRFLSGQGGLGRLYCSLGYRPSPRVCEHGFLDLLAGRIYTDPDRQSEMFGAGLPWGYDLAAVRRDPRLAERGPNQLVPERADPWLLFRLPAILWTVWRAARRLRQDGLRAAGRFVQQELPRYRAYVAGEQARDLAGLSDQELVEAIEQRCGRVLDEFGAELLRPGLYAGVAAEALEKHLTQFLGSDEGSRQLAAVAVGADPDSTNRPESCLSLVGQGQLSLVEFLARCGHRGPNELELAAPRWREMPDEAARYAAGTKLDAAARRDCVAAERAWASASLRERLAAEGASSFSGRLERELAAVQRWLSLRETAKHHWLMGYALIREAVLELARRANLGQQVFFLRYEELRQFPWPDGVGRVAPDVLATRQEHWRVLQRLAVPEVVEIAHLEAIGTVAAAESAVATRLDAQVLSRGIARGPVRIITADQPLAGEVRGCVLVCPALEPGLMPLLLDACAVVAERGGVLSHGAIVARQWGLPAVVVADASRLLRDGQTVVVDADHGCVLCEGGPAR